MNLAVDRQAGEFSARLEFFDSLAERWDEQVATDSFMRRLRHAVAALEIGETETVLDLGCGTGNLAVVLAEHLSSRARILAADLSEGMLARARAKLPADPRVEWLHADAVALPVPAATVDRVVCLSTWPHFQEARRVAEELLRILRPDGLLHVLHLDGRETINDLHRGIGGAIGGDLLPSAAELGAFLARAGFEIRELYDEPDHYLVTAARPLE